MYFFKLLFEKVLTSPEHAFIISLSEQSFRKMVIKMRERNANTSKSNKRRYKIVKPFRFFIFVLICLMAVVLAGYGIIGSVRADAEPHVDYSKVKIQADDTLWDIVETYNSDADIDIRSALYDIYEINDISAGDIHPGDVILVPVYR